MICVGRLFCGGAHAATQAAVAPRPRIIAAYVPVHPHCGCRGVRARPHCFLVMWPHTCAPCAGEGRLILAAVLGCDVPLGERLYRGGVLPYVGGAVPGPCACARAPCVCLLLRVSVILRVCASACVTVSVSVSVSLPVCVLCLCLSLCLCLPVSLFVSICVSVCVCVYLCACVCVWRVRS